MMASSAELSKPRRIRYLIIDFEHVRNLDVSAIKAFLEVPPLSPAHVYQA
jgi:hypothetical protein